MHAPRPLFLLSLALLIAACDTTDDDPGEDPAPVDVDADGFDETQDCDDDDPGAYPGATETCDGVDNDCDGEVDNAATDAATFYADADADGFGDGETPIAACEPPDGFVDNTDDCDDLDGAVNPRADEVACDGVDNNCDSETDLNTVPGVFASLQDAMDGLEDGAEICLEPGRYTERLDLSGRTLLFTGQQGSAETFLVVDSGGPLITVVGESDRFEAGEVTLSGLSIVGEVSADATDRLGGFAYLQGGTLRMEDMVISELSGSMANGGTLEGLLVYAVDSSVHLQDVNLDGVSLSLSGASTGSERLVGGLFRTVRGELEMTTVAIDGLTVQGDEARENCIALGVVLAASDNENVNKDVGDLEGTRIDIDGLEVRDSTLSLRCARSSGLGGLLRLSDVGGELADLRVSGTSFEAFGAGYGGFGSIASTSSFVDRGLAFSDLHLSDNTFRTGGDGYGGIGALVDTRRVDLTGVTIWNNSLTASNLDGGGTSSLLRTQGGSLGYIDVRGNTLVATEDAGALIESAASERDGHLEHFIVAGNRVEAPTLYGAALDLLADGADLEVRYGDVVGNRFQGEVYDFHGGVVRAGGEGEGDFVTVSAVQIVDNVHVQGEAPPAVASWWEESLGLQYCNLFGNGGEETEWGQVSGSEGTIAADPLYADVTGTDPTLWDLRLKTGSPAVDAGPPDERDPDGSRADLGAYGGGSGADW